LQVNAVEKISRRAISYPALKPRNVLTSQQQQEQQLGAGPIIGPTMKIMMVLSLTVARCSRSKTTAGDLINDLLAAPATTFGGHPRP
jgi:hypothetical protein